MAENKDSPHIWLEAIQKDAGLLQFLPEEFQVEEIYLAAVQQYGRALEYVPESLKTEAMCFAAVQQDGWAFEHVPESLKTEALCIAAVQKNNWMFKYIPESIMTEAICLAAVTYYGRMLEYVPKSLKTEAVCLAAMQDNFIAGFMDRVFNFVPKKLKTQVLMKSRYGSLFGEQKIKEILTTIRNSDRDFEILIKKRIGNCSCSGDTITLSLFSFNSNNGLIETAIHEYAHHLMWGKGYDAHGREFWECFLELLAIADKKNFYSCDIDKSPHLKKITAIIKHNDLLKNNKLFEEGFGDILCIIKKLCHENGIFFEYYTLKYLEADWYKKKNPYLNYYPYYFAYSSHKTEKELDDLLDNFLKVYRVE